MDTFLVSGMPTTGTDKFVEEQEKPMFCDLTNGTSYIFKMDHFFQVCLPLVDKFVEDQEKPMFCDLTNAVDIIVASENNVLQV